MNDMSGGAVTLVEVDDDDFAWMLLDEPPRRNGLTVAPGGVDEPAVLAQVRRLTARVHAGRCRGGWMIVVGDEVVGLCGFHAPPVRGEVAIGYSIAATRRGRGFATAAVGAVIRRAPEFKVTELQAETSVTNVASERVLERNGFTREGRRTDPDDGELTLWRRGFPNA
jgi:RimJ/RimL family protein N-acetyltransferase